MGFPAVIGFRLHLCLLCIGVFVGTLVGGLIHEFYTSILFCIIIGMCACLVQFQLVAETHIAGEVAHVVHVTVDAEIVAVNGVFLIGVKVFGVACITGVSRQERPLQVERYLAHAVDGVVNLFAHIGHAVLGALQHHAAAIDTAHIRALNSVQQSAGIDGAESVGRECVLGGLSVGFHQFQVILFPDGVVGRFVCSAAQCNLAGADIL